MDIPIQSYRSEGRRIDLAGGQAYESEEMIFCCSGSKRIELVEEKI